MDFKVCPKCGMSWKAREEFVLAPDISVLGYQANFKNPTEGWFLFTHKKAGCGTTNAVSVGNFIDIYNGLKFTQNLTGSQECLGHCLNIRNLEMCQAPCSLAYLREILKVIKNPALFEHFTKHLQCENSIVEH